MRALFLGFALIAYAIFFATFLYLIGFVGNLAGPPITVDVGPAASVGSAFVTDIALVAIFGVQHSVMARQGFKRAWTKTVPLPIERSVYVLFASAALIIMFIFWRPIPAMVWDVANPVGQTILWALFAAGWGIVLLSTFLINHFELFGLQQAWLHLRGREAAPPVFRQPLMYKWVRHPLYLGFFLAFWATPHMSYGHLLLSAGVSIYMLIAIRYEERDLIGLFGRDYVEYRGRVG
ncbi:MAG TPA: isoprenylcysteine carboxylmethyltransferase family protein, partial [Croceibacterium sp.]